MTTPTRDAIESFKSITGESESVALRKLEEYGGNLNAAVSAHFLELERSITNPVSSASSQNNFVDTNNQSGLGTGGIVPLISAVRRFRPSLLLDPNYRRNLLNQIGTPNFNHYTTSPHMGEVTGVPVGFNSRNEHPLNSGVRPVITDSPGTPSYYGEGTYNNVSRDDHQHTNDIESEMMQAAIEASKRDFGQTYMNERRGSFYGSSSVGLQQQQEDEELARAISLSLKTADEEKAMRMPKDHYEQMGTYDSNDKTTETTNNSSKCVEFKIGNSSLRQLPVTHESVHDTQNHLLSKDSLNSNEWVDISQKELDEAIMLETQLFSQISEGSSYHPSHEQGGPGSSINPGLEAVSCPQPSSLMDQRLLRQQQDEEYLISLLADKEKEMIALKKAESHSLKEESLRKKHEGEEVNKVMSAKSTSLPPEPAIDDENAITILVRIPDGTRRGRRFRKSDKLQLLFDFIGVGEVVKPGTYRVVRPYPRRAFGAADCSLSFNQLGLTGKQEALFLEFI
ncbi:plant UBX domain-containing protein 9 isoform X1 [Gossypium raimondii]|uniref:plant UBX domain-containing protein 9 isoform X1 n=1 Tax=Gossypium raimondii TaxID=29730 RepID=UPI00227C94EA|nr:plant UBX domain-containing protein 9 isoform X1 [Gossypium raimondii]XP_052489551.1 plant UBX domain-containing protein 9 isoform X1 [Gossypium raimondii]